MIKKWYAKTQLNELYSCTHFFIFLSLIVFNLWWILYYKVISILQGCFRNNVFFNGDLQSNFFALKYSYNGINQQIKYIKLATIFYKVSASKWEPFFSLETFLYLVSINLVIKFMHSIFCSLMTLFLWYFELS